MIDFTIPVEEGGTLTLLCETIGGEPLPRLTWWKGSGTKLIDSTTEYIDSQGKVVRNRLIMKNMMSQFCINLICPVLKEKGKFWYLG